MKTPTLCTHEALPPESEDDVPDVILVARARDGNREALDQLVRRHQSWLFNLALRMAGSRACAEDATQDILLKAVTKLDGFRGECPFSAWLYRIAVNHLLNVRKSRPEARGITFVTLGRTLDEDRGIECADQTAAPVVQQLLTEETRHACMNGMLLCLDRRQRTAYILGEIFGESSEVGGTAMNISPENFRQLLSRARRDLRGFMQNRCGLVNQANPCRCARKTRAFINASFVDPHQMQFTRERVAAVADAAPRRMDDLSELDRAHARLFRENAFVASPDYAARVRALIEAAGFDRDDAANAPMQPVSPAAKRCEIFPSAHVRAVGKATTQI